jgi:hypothetical protein
MSNMASKLKPMDADLELKPTLLVHLVMASLPIEFDNFVINYNMSPDKRDIDCHMCARRGYAQRVKWWFHQLCQGQQEKELPEQQPRFSLQAIWQRSPTVSLAHSPSG